ATLPGADGEAAAAPFAAGAWLFSHNGAVRGWPGTLAPLVTALPPEDVLSLEARSDSAFVWALVLARLRAGDEEGQALADTVLEVAAAAPASRLNLVLTQGDTITATAWGDTLWYLARPGGGTVVASEPYDDDPHWREVPDRTLLAASRTDVLLTPLKEPGDALASTGTPAPHTPAPPKEPRT
ncbi:class II glutamine amidotransferase, partial [Streptomyces pratens]